ncbi:MAG: mechanosensitive ion channel domain-containing protein [Gammaproteobacteria bacterium]
MNAESLNTTVLEWLSQNVATLFVSGAVILAYFLLNWLIARLANQADSRSSRKDAAQKVISAARLVTTFFTALALMVVWGIDFGSVVLFATTSITLLGVALFASWSLLSNVTAYFVLLFHPQYSRGTFIRIVDADNYVEGSVADLSVFSLKLITEENETIIYPNNLLLGRVVVVNPENRLNTFGKIVNPLAAEKIDSTPAQ